METLIDSKNSHVIVIRNWLSKKKSKRLFKKLVSSDGVLWEKKKMKFMGKEILEPRKTFVCGNKGLIHKYSGLVRPVQEWLPEIKKLRDKIHKESDIDFNACLLNYYTSGDDYIGWHSDKETSPPHFVVVTISLGGERDFVLKHKTTHQTIKTTLYTGDICMMYGQTQRDWKHSIPKRKTQTKPRISLTFRELKH